MFFKRLLKPSYTPPAPSVSPPMPDQQEQDIDILARTIWGEARGESLTGQEAVAHVILNRHRVATERGRMWWGNTIRDICRKPYQFSCWNHDDPNYIKLMNVTPRDAVFAQCLRIARRAVHGALSSQTSPDPTFGATHYHTDSIMPTWARGQNPTALIGRHVFYRILD
jgi:N-acetylmuramoyl-L-alanine amidase